MTKKMGVCDTGEIKHSCLQAKHALVDHLQV
jgi:hypothetical protein